MARKILDLDKRQLLERVQEQEGVIRKLWDRYTHDVGHEPEVSELTAGRNARYIPARTDVIRRALDREQSFEEAVEEFDFQWTHSYTEATTQRQASRLMHGRKPAVVARKAGDLVLKGFWGKGVSMPVFEKLLQKLRGLKLGSIRLIDLSDNGFNANFVPGIIEILRRGARQLNLADNAIESAAMQQLCSALPEIAQHLEMLDLRFNPCSSDAAFVRCLAGVVPQLRCLDRLAVTIRCDVDNEPPVRYNRPASASQISEAGARPKSGRAGQPQQRNRSSTPGRRNPSTSNLDASSWRVRSMSQSYVRSASQSNIQRSRVSPRGDSRPEISGIDAGGPFARGGALGRDAGVSLFRGIAESLQIRVLDLRSSSLSLPAVQRLSHFVRMDQLVGLSMADCFLGDNAVPLLDAIATCTKMVWLNLRLNGLRCSSHPENKMYGSANTGFALCRALDASVSLTDVDMASNELGDDFGEGFARVISSNEVLWKVDLYRNPLGLRTGDALLEALQRSNTTLVTIGDTVQGFFALGLQNRYQIQCHLDANRKSFELGYRPADGLLPDVMDPGLADFEFRILDHDPSTMEPLILLR